MRELLHKFDKAVTGFVQAWPDWMQPLMYVITTIGRPIVTLGVAFLIMAFGVVRANMALALAGAFAAVALGVGSWLKLVLHRERPLSDYVALMHFDSFSFPSGHTLGSTVSFGLLAYLAWQFSPSPWGGVAAGILIGLIIAVGFSRIYLGAHFPSDVLAGWLMGAGALLIIIFVVQPKI